MPALVKLETVTVLLFVAANLDPAKIVMVDAEGNVVAMTSTIESPFGSRIMVRGFLLNNQLTDFDFVPGSANEVQPRKRPRSSMAPIAAKIWMPAIKPTMICRLFLIR